MLCITVIAEPESALMLLVPPAMRNQNVCFDKGFRIHLGVINKQECFGAIKSIKMQVGEIYSGSKNNK